MPRSFAARTLLAVVGVLLASPEPACAAGNGAADWIELLGGSAPPTAADSGEEAVDSALLGAIRAWRQARDARRASEQRVAAAAAAPRSRRQHMRTNPRWDHAAELEYLTPFEFRRCFGVDIDTFDYLLTVLRDDITPSLSHDGAPRGGYRGVLVPAEQKLALTLRWLRGASYIDQTYMGHYESRATFYQHNKTVIRAINRHFHFSLRRSLEAALAGQSRDDLDERTVAFGAASQGCIDMCIGALDGVHVRTALIGTSACARSRPRVLIPRPLPCEVLIKQPPRRREVNRARWINKNGKASINVQAIADSDRTFSWAAIGIPGANPDLTAYRSTSFFEVMRSVARVFGYFLVADAGYVDCEELLIPWPTGPSVTYTSAKGVFNHYQSSTRQAIECAFGMWERRWGVLWRRLEVETCFATDVIQATMLLHNLCVERNVRLPPNDDRFVPLERTSDRLAGRPPAPRANTLRERITEAIRAAGLTRGPLPSGLVAPQAVDATVSGA